MAQRRIRRPTGEERLINFRIKSFGPSSKVLLQNLCLDLFNPLHNVPLRTAGGALLGPSLRLSWRASWPKKCAFENAFQQIEKMLLLFSGNSDF